ncbi:uncharacterized protein LOC131676530 isoform X1 [Topomyia yanbarensis]|uniref:uncharacterized protein LOC131676530 isoform X1 n=1 Tax=Topomyia yanbarensis TaxID=2498891 RepID=UPI00273CE6B9|nr:uncharacterized protein LOC131676530 isoform X1 [Topomyia yanbarensis]
MKQLIFLLLVAVTIGPIKAQSNRQCAANGEYCLTHSECCSGSCLSFSYKCVPVPPGPNIGTTFVPVTVDTSNRFGGSDDGGASITQKTCARNGEYCQTHAECCSGSCLSFSYKCVPVPGTSSQSQPPVQTTAPSQGVSSTVDLGNRVGEGQSTAPVNNITPPPKKCAALGEYCLNSAECCFGACLSFSYKCVTNPQLDVVGRTEPVRPSSPSSAPVSVGLINRFDGNTDASTQKPQKCAAVGEYCLTSSECCSKSCLSFSYKCVQTYDLATQQNTQLGIPVQLPSVSNSAIDTTNRFGGSERQCTSNGLYCFHNRECCSGACYKSFCQTEIKLGVPESELTRPSISNGPYVQVNSLDDLITRFGGTSQRADDDSNASGTINRSNVLQARDGTARQCAVVGASCSRHQDCCSQRCHSYRRKCVT